MPNGQDDGSGTRNRQKGNSPVAHALDFCYTLAAGTAVY